MADEAQEMTQDDEDFEEIDYHEFPDVKIDFDKTPTVTGILLWRETVDTEGLDGQPRKATMYALVSSDGEEVGVWGSANLDAQMKHVEDGEEIRIRFVEMKKLSGGRSMRRFQVLRRKGTWSARQESGS